MGFLIVVVGGTLLIVSTLALIDKRIEGKKLARMSPAGRNEYHRQAQIVQEKQHRQAMIWSHGFVNAAMICPHCQTSGPVHTRRVTKKRGISGAKATGALLTGGVSILATGLSAKEASTEAFCGNCRNTWSI
jgi:hypothetical protein